MGQRGPLFSVKRVDLSKGWGQNNYVKKGEGLSSRGDCLKWHESGGGGATNYRENMNHNKDNSIDAVSGLKKIGEVSDDDATCPPWLTH